MEEDVYTCHADFWVLLLLRSSALASGSESRLSEDSSVLVSCETLTAFLLQFVMLRFVRLGGRR